MLLFNLNINNIFYWTNFKNKLLLFKTTLILKNNDRNTTVFIKTKKVLVKKSVFFKLLSNFIKLLIILIKLFFIKISKKIIIKVLII